MIMVCSKMSLERHRAMLQKLGLCARQALPLAHFRLLYCLISSGKCVYGRPVLSARRHPPSEMIVWAPTERAIKRGIDGLQVRAAQGSPRRVSLLLAIFTSRFTPVDACLRYVRAPVCSIRAP